jgi:molecular chaperone Hsp33
VNNNINKWVYMSLSRQFSFINNQHGFTISLIEGHSLIDEIIKVHNIGPNALDFYQKTVLGSLQLINFLKPGETLGFYIDSEEPYFRFKIEMSNNGTLRTLLLPEEFDDFPVLFTGNCRVNKIFASKSPYTSIIDYKDFKVQDIANELMDKSYQTNGKILVAEDASCSLLVIKLPPTNINKKIDDYEDLSMDDFLKTHQELIDTALNFKNSDIEKIESAFLEKEFRYLGSKEVKFDCPCSHERMVNNLFTLSESDRLDIFVDKEFIETRCDYCNTIYKIETKEILKPQQ